MRRAVLDTNVLVSGALNAQGPPGRLLDAVADGLLEPVVSRAILTEYAEVLARPHFGFSTGLVERILHPFEALALIVEPDPIDKARFPDPDDAVFVAVARLASCPVITGNTRHFPPESQVDILTPAEAMRWLTGPE